MRSATAVRAAAAAVVVTLAAATVSGCSSAASGGPALRPALPHADLRAGIADTSGHAADGVGDLWPSCWADDDALYAANGDGSAFGDEDFDVAVSRITGDLGHLEGTTLAGGDAVGQVWSGSEFTRKPTGMVCTHGSIYLAVQDLRKDFNTAPAATIARSDDHGRTWTWDRSAPMFPDGVFTTIFFADYGKDSAGAPGDWVYAYGLDGNWRDSFDDAVPDPQDLYLARVPADRVQERAAWRFFAGGTTARPRWSADIGAKKPVLHDDRRRFPSGASSAGPAGGTVGASDLSVISQGGVTYDAPLKKYLYTSWTEFTFEFSEADLPWGPFTLFLSTSYGRYPWTEQRHGGYATTIPSKFLSADGRTAWVQSNVCPCADAGMDSYYFGLRELRLAPAG